MTKEHSVCRTPIQLSGVTVTPKTKIQGVTAIIVLGHLGSGLTPNGVGSDAFDLICRPDPGMAHSRLKGLGEQ